MRVAAITGRELRAYFLSPGGYVVAALLTALNGWIFARFVLNPGEPASMRPVFVVSIFVFTVICPAITMRAISEELRLGTIEILLSSPVRTADIVLGKFAAALVFLAALLAPTILFVIALEVYGRPDYGELACGYAGVLLAGAAFLASGILASSLTANQVIAYLLTFLFWLLVVLTTIMLPRSDLLAGVGWDLGGVLLRLNPLRRLQDFAIGLFDSANFVYFLSITVVMLIGAVRALELRRWR